MSNRLSFRWLAVAAPLALLVGACTIDGDEGGAGSDVTSAADVSAPQSGDVSVDLSAVKSSVSASERVVVKVTLTNIADHPVRLPSWYAPSEELEEDLFVVTRAGTSVEFIGPHYKRSAPVDADYVTLAPGKSVTREVDITAFYDLTKSADYSIRYETDILSPGAKEPALALSNTVNLWIEGRSIEQKPSQPTANFGTIGFNKCTTDQQNLILQARDAASSMANNAVAYLNGTAAANPRYTTWFGAYSQNGWNTAKSHFVAIKDAFDTKPLTFDCGCKKKYYAYVYPNQPYNIYVCSVFWDAPISGTDSKGGTIIHETSHFTAVAGTDDYVYGQSGAKSLAISDPSKALFNADSHEYFGENTPALQ